MLFKLHSVSQKRSELCSRSKEVSQPAPLSQHNHTSALCSRGEYPTSWRDYNEDEREGRGNTREGCTNFINGTRSLSILPLALLLSADQKYTRLRTPLAAAAEVDCCAHITTRAELIPSSYLCDTFPPKAIGLNAGPAGCTSQRQRKRRSSCAELR